MKIKLKDLEKAKSKEEVIKFDYIFSEYNKEWIQTDRISSDYDFYLVISDRDGLETYLCWNKSEKFGNIFCVGRPKGAYELI